MPRGSGAMSQGHEGDQMATLKLRVSGMTCGHCQAKVEQALKRANGVYSAVVDLQAGEAEVDLDRKSTRLNSSHGYISYAVFCLKKKRPSTSPGIRDARRRPRRQSI